MENNDKIHYVECGCKQMEHTIRFMYFDDDKDFVYVDYHLPCNRLHKRILSAIKHIFGYKSKNGDFGDAVWDKEMVEKCVNFLNGFINGKNM